MEDKITLKDRILATWTPTRIVTILAPILFIPLAGFITLTAGKYGIDLNHDETLNAIMQIGTFVVGSGIAWLSSSKWLDGRHEWENKLEEALNAAQPFIIDPDVVYVGGEDEDTSMLQALNSGELTDEDFTIDLEVEDVNVEVK